MNKHNISFEFFPAKTENGAISLINTASQLAHAFTPNFMSVTYGAAGGSKDKTIQTLSNFQGVTDAPLAAHLTHISHSKEELFTHTKQLKEMGIHHIVALRGDLPQDGSNPRQKPDTDYFEHTNNFVEALKQWHGGFEISVGAYPEKHPNAPSLKQDILNLQKKCDAGADRALTQFFFDNTIFYEFREKAAKIGLETPIVPGMMRIASIEGIMNFAPKIGATIPKSLTDQFANATDPNTVAKEILFKQVEDLSKNGVKDFHFYTMNKADGFQKPIDFLKSLNIG